MTPVMKRFLAVAAVAGISTLAAFFYVKQGSVTSTPTGLKNTASMLPGAPTEERLNQALADAKLPINGLTVRITDGVTVVRGRTSDPAAVASALDILQQLGAPRVMNVIRVEARTTDDEIARVAERRLVSSPGLEGCQFKVSSRDGVLQINGTIYSELQRETALRVLRKIEGVSQVRTDLKKL